ncbi:MAG: hypothetical protein GYA61_03275, partial [Spirochaetales bacterium]|nr:hypothetical protein [Spirochaetales bacterium]
MYKIDIKKKNIKKLYLNIKTILLIFLLLSLIFTSFNKIYAQEFNRVKRESIPYSITFSFSFYYYGSSSFTSYSFNPYIYLNFSILKNLDLFFQIPMDFYYSKSYETRYDEEFNPYIVKSEDYLLSLSSILLGFQYTFYTNFINDLFFYINYPIGIYPIFYKRSSSRIETVSPIVTISLGYRLTFIYDPLLFSMTSKITANYNIPKVIEEKGNWTQKYSLSCKFNLTVVLNTIFSTSISITP